MNKPAEIYRTTLCGNYQISNYCNLKTTPYKFFKEKNLIESKNLPIRIADNSKKSSRRAMMLSGGYGLSNNKIKKRASEVFTEEEMMEVTIYERYLLDLADERER